MRGFKTNTEVSRADPSTPSPAARNFGRIRYCSGLHLRRLDSVPGFFAGFMGKYIDLLVPPKNQKLYCQLCFQVAWRKAGDKQSVRSRFVISLCA